MEGFTLIEYEPYKISYDKDEDAFFFYRSHVPEFRPTDYILFHNISNGMKTTFELREQTEDAMLYMEIGNYPKKPSQLLAIKKE